MTRLACLVLSLACTMYSGCTDGDRLNSSAAEPNADSNVTSEPPQSPNDSVVTLAPAAVVKFREFLQESPGSYIRLSVKNDGSTGFMYDLQIENPPIPPDDRIDQSNGFPFVVSRRDALYLDGATIDWETNSDGTAGFKFDNPNAIDPNGA